MTSCGGNRVLAGGVLLLACVMVGCGGGSAAQQSAAITPAPTPAPSPNPSTTGTSLAISTSELPIGNVQQAYAAVLSATGNTGAVKWAVVSGALPTGVALASESGVISGTPTAPGVYTVGIKAADAGGSVSRTLKIHVSGNGAFYHKYTKPGTYNVKVTTVDAQGNTATATQTIVVSAN